MKNNGKKIISTIAVLAMSATAVLGAMSFTGCSDKDVSGDVSSNNTGYSTTSISTARGTATSVETGTVYYVSPDATAEGNGNGELGSETNPYKIEKLLGTTNSPVNILKAGDTVRLKPGVYNLTETITIQQSGNFNSYITIMNDSTTEQATLSFYGQSFLGTSRGVQIYGSYIYWYDIDVCGAGDNGMYIGGSYNTIENCEFYDNRDTGLQLGRSGSDVSLIKDWPSYNLVKNCTSHNNYDNETYGENADGFAAKLTIGYGNVFDGCIAYRNADDGWDLYAKSDTGNIGCVIIYNCVAFENGFLEYTQAECNSKYPTYNAQKYDEPNTNSYTTRDGDGNGFKLGGSVMEGDVVMYNCLSFNNKLHGVTDNSNPGVLSVNNVTSYDNAASIDNYSESETFGQVKDWSSITTHPSTSYDKSGSLLDSLPYKGEGNNIDVARWTNSYNNLTNVLSVNSVIGSNLGTDEYRGSVKNSIFAQKANGTKAYKVEGAMDADTQNANYGTEIDTLVASDIFETLPVVKDGTSYTYNLTGCRDSSNASGNVHARYRNADGSINMGSVLAVKDYTKLLGDDNKIGSVLNKTSYDEYTHFAAVNSYNTELESSTTAMLTAAYNALTVSCDTSACYQDFEVVTLMRNCEISWKSSDSSILEVGTDVEISESGSREITITVWRDLNEDKDVTLTATIKVGDQTMDKDFVIHVMKDTPGIGDIYVVTDDGSKIENGASIILDQYVVLQEPALVVENSADYNGKKLSPDQYTVETTYLYAESADGNFVKVKGFTPSNPGVFKITHKVTFKGNSADTATYTYSIYPASITADVKFLGDATINVTRNGYAISGTPTNVTGTLYAVSSATELDVTLDNITTLDGVKSYDFRTDSLNLEFENDNTAEYNIYYAFANVYGTVTKLYSAKVGVVSISSEADFMKVCQGSVLGSETPSTTIYTLSKDLDFTGTTWKASGKFTALINGLGHTVANIDTTANSLFAKFNGGTLMNIKFNNIKIEASSNKAGIVAECYGGYFYNIQITNINISGKQRTGGLIGQVLEGTPVYIEQVSLVNETGYSITSADTRIGGLVGFVQPTSAPAVGSICKVYIDNCYVYTDITASNEIGGILATYEGKNSNVDFYLSISHCYYNGTITVTGNKTFASGILGYQKEAYAVMDISYSISAGQIIYNGEAVEGAQKNCSGVVGGYSTVASGTVTRCISLIEAYNAEYDVVKTTSDAIKNTILYTSILSLDTDTRWTFCYEEGSTTLQSPYVTLNFLGNWD